MTNTKTVIVEGKTDKEKLLQLLNEEVEIICTHGTLGEEELEHLIPRVDERDLYIMVDADQPGMKLRDQLKREFPNATHLYTRKKYKEIATTPLDYLVKRLHDAHFKLKSEYIPLLWTKEDHS